MVGRVMRHANNFIKTTISLPAGTGAYPALPELLPSALATGETHSTWPRIANKMYTLALYTRRTAASPRPVDTAITALKRWYVRH